MSEEQLKAFLEKVKADTSVQEKLKAASDADAVVAIAKAAGFTITTEDLNSHRQNLTEDELEGVAGGGCKLGSFVTYTLMCRWATHCVGLGC
ncbi:Nif11-like leader peptide family natural product precursor [Synechococcus sp. RS9916]|uniref:Nif11-like leader peptide family natural product precursor n=1 Tax=Synechococcus sp. RS9916 TaxID=221359 RepID=UPI0000E533A5|nr:Nif11-like leader peptide family natural product precursor [Synechococcus sp. RS9916]EAU74282.1 possible (M20568) ORF 11 (Azotobacter vinelandii) [Synechococcus sp. RS9916]